MDHDGEAKLDMIWKIIEAMPEEMDVEFICNLFSTTISTYGLTDDLQMIMLLTAHMVEQNRSIMEDVVIH